jgi:hypothetical protein
MSHGAGLPIVWHRDAGHSGPRRYLRRVDIQELGGVTNGYRFQGVDNSGRSLATMNSQS